MTLQYHHSKNDVDNDTNDIDNNVTVIQIILITMNSLRDGLAYLQELFTVAEHREEKVRSCLS